MWVPRFIKPPKMDDLMHTNRHIYPTWMVKYSNDSIHTTSVLKWLAELDPQPSKVIKVSKQATNETSM